MMAVSDDARVRPGLRDRDRTHGDIRLILVITAILDVMVIVVAVIIAWDLRIAFDVFSMDPLGVVPVIAQATPWLIGGWFVALVAQGGYSARNFAAGPDEYRAVAIASLVTAGVVAMTCYLLQLPLSRGFLVLSFFIGIPLLLLERWGLRKIVHRMRMRGRLLHRVIAVGGPSGIGEVVDSLRRAQYVGYQVVGACVPDGLSVEDDRFPVPVLGTVADTRRLCDEYGADTVLVARGGYGTSHELRRIAWALEGSSIELVVVPSLTDVAGPRIHMRPVAGLPLLHLEQPQAGAAGGLSKRLFDLVFSALALVVLSPLLLVVAVLVKVHDGGPIFFRQSRVGREGKTFGMLKFRSMVVDAEERLADVLDLNESDGVLFKIKDDPRITPLGRWMRRFSVDEVPQLVNVLRGEMSLVGPRPERPGFVEEFTRQIPFYAERHCVKPGITGWAQVNYPYGASLDDARNKLAYDLYYVKNRGMFLDLIVVLQTVRVILLADGAR
jgi:exopolysaccharide biosynthesis polyprenyl glycosylphosphotransferase